MSILQGQTTQFKINILSGLENFASGTPYTYKIALYTGNAALDNTTASYTTANEISGAGYTAGGKNLTITQVPVGDLNSNTNASICVLDFGSDKTNTQAGTFTITFPTPTATNAIIRIS